MPRPMAVLRRFFPLSSLLLLLAAALFCLAGLLLSARWRLGAAGRLAGVGLCRRPRALVHRPRVGDLIQPEAEDHLGVLPEFLQIVEHRRGRFIALVQIRAHGVHRNLLQAPGDGRVDGGRHRRGGVDMLDGHGDGGLAVIGRAARQHFVHDDAQGVDIRPVIDPAALGLLRGDIVDRAQGLPGQRALGGDDPGDAEVRHLDTSIFQDHDIMGLDIPVNNAAAVGVLQGLGDLHGEVQRLPPIEDTLPSPYTAAA